MPEAGWIRSAGGVVLRPQEVLLIRVSDIKGRPVWSFPKGRLDAGETPAQAAVREVMEETGWCCRIEADLSTTEYWFQREGRRFRKTVVWFKMVPLERSGVPDGEVEEVEWVEREEALRRLTYPSDVQLLSQALAQKASSRS
ncbi:MAG TPA: NUDIX domain-containing protein [Nitrospira sp.]|nr:NUDIX domain-containing protein [Nitrospira sp.]MBS0161556.1 NUDIX domain-containing protein [Nitrospira sp.]MBS0176564.1 NUDIX domain-containing protein [Nitrospira sp.]MBS0179822.1 NUDIX domain-containing protein [Nitrospira sp.]MBX3337523.1 NUDIX domain-containing protein [Nitrospira sp.]